MATTNKRREKVEYRKVITRELPFWVVTFYAPGLPAEGRQRPPSHAETAARQARIIAADAPREARQ